MTENITVYSYRRCPFAMRVRLTLYEKNIPFEVVEEDLAQFSDKLRSLHPEAKVPVLVHGATVLYESSIITEYIEERFPGGIVLMPVDSAGRAEVRLWTYWCNQIFKPTLDRFKYGTARFAAEECVGAEVQLLAQLDKLEQRLALSPWLVGENYSLADIHVFPFVRQLTRVNPTPSFLPGLQHLMKWAETISIRPAFLKVM